METELVRYKTAILAKEKGFPQWIGVKNHFKDEFGKILIKEDIPDRPLKVACYARVSSSQNKDNLERQANRLIDYANASGFQVATLVKEVGSGLNDNRPKLAKLLDDIELTHIIVEHKDRLTRFGFNYIKNWMNSSVAQNNQIQQGRSQSLDLNFELLQKLSL